MRLSYNYALPVTVRNRHQDAKINFFYNAYVNYEITETLTRCRIIDVLCVVVFSLHHVRSMVR